jgi:peptidoglycan-N-acetylglucosamine deacetylase
VVGSVYLERGEPVVVLARWGRGGGPRNVLIRRKDGTEVVRPFRGLRKIRRAYDRAMERVDARHGITTPVVALTFDDGPSPWTLPIADALERHGSRGTFFALGDATAADGGGDILRRLVDAGHEVGNHTFTHPYLTTLEDDAIRDELGRAGDELQEALGFRPAYWRAPFFDSDERVRAALNGLAGREVWYSTMPEDWDRPGEETARRVLDVLQPGDIVVLHDGRPATEPAHLSWPTRDATVEAVELILAEMTARGMRSVTVSELVAAS